MSFYLVFLVFPTVSPSGNSLREHYMTPCNSPVGPWECPPPLPSAMAMVSLKFYLTSLFLPAVDSEKSLSPLVDDIQPFTVPFRPYAWSSFTGPGLRSLVQQGLHPGVEVDTGPAAIPFYGDRSSLYTEQALGEETYRRQAAAAALLFPERRLHGKNQEVKASSNLLCSSLILNGAYKCVECSKVRCLHSFSCVGIHALLLVCKLQGKQQECLIIWCVN